MIQLIIVNNPVKPEFRVERYVRAKHFKLFLTEKENDLEAVFDRKGFWIDHETQKIYNGIRNQPHIYVAFTKNKKGYFYIGISNQKGGRWKRSHAYHLGTLAHTFLGTLKNGDQPHFGWVDKWMDEQTINKDIYPYTVLLKEQVYISFIPFEIYHDVNYKRLSLEEVVAINKKVV